MLTLVTAPTQEPVTLAELKDHAEVHSSITRHDAKLTRYLEVARQSFEVESGYHIALATYTLTLSNPCSLCVVLPKRPVSAVTEVKAGETVLVADTDYTVATSLQGISTVTFETAQADVSITFDVGFGFTEGVVDDPETEDVDETVAPVSLAPNLARHAILTLASFMYRNPDAFASLNVPMAATPNSYRSIVSMYRLA